MLSGRGLCGGPIFYPEAPTKCDVSECDRESAIVRRPWHTGGGVTGPSYGQQQNSLQCCHMACVYCYVGNKLSFHLNTK